MLAACVADLLDRLASPQGELAQTAGERPERGLRAAMARASLAAIPPPAPGADARALGAWIESFLGAAGEVWSLAAERGDELRWVAEACRVAEANARGAFARECGDCMTAHGPEAFLALGPAPAGADGVLPGDDARLCPCGAVVWLPGSPAESAPTPTLTPTPEGGPPLNAVTCPACASTFTPTLWPALRRATGGLRDDLHVAEDGRAAFERVPCLCGGAPLDLPLATGGGPLARCWRSGGLTSGSWLVEVDPEPKGRYLIARRVPSLEQSPDARPRFYDRASGRERRSAHTRTSESYLPQDDLQRVLRLLGEPPPAAAAPVAEGASS